MEEKKLKIILNKSGNGNINTRCPIPIDWFRKLGFTEQEVEANARLEEIDGKYKLVIEK